MILEQFPILKDFFFLSKLTKQRRNVAISTQLPQRREREPTVLLSLSFMRLSVKVTGGGASVSEEELGVLSNGRDWGKEDADGRAKESTAWCASSLHASESRFLRHGSSFLWQCCGGPPTFSGCGDLEITRLIHLSGLNSPTTADAKSLMF